MHVSLRLADYDVVVTTFSLVSKEIPVQKEEAHNPCKDLDNVVNTESKITASFTCKSNVILKMISVDA